MILFHTVVTETDALVSLMLKRIINLPKERGV